MKSFFRLTISLIFIFAFSFCQTVSTSPYPDRYFDTAETAHKEARLVVFYPSTGTIKALVELLRQNFLLLDQIEVVGVYHEKELTDYEASKSYVQDNNLNWFKFHRVTAELDENALFQRNSCSQEFEDIFKKSDGMIFFGGPDIPPAVYNSKTSLLTRITDPCRHNLELSFIFHLLGGFQDEDFPAFLDSRPSYPILGICLGSQSLNVGTGGTLVQDIWSETYGKVFVEDVIALGQNNWHTNPYARLHPEDSTLTPFMLHPVALLEGSKFCTELGFQAGDNPYMLSSHHQGAGRLGKGFRVAATSLDGKVIEAIEHERFLNVLGVQFHPEYPVLWGTVAKYKFTPQDTPLICLKTYLENHPPSFEFHKKIWSWFYGALVHNLVRDREFEL
ncbi:MAG: gamma-glutamyl-gamma-aminobutyrate hydrolase family protein [Candidatus Aminicenantales bacterium]